MEPLAEPTGVSEVDALLGHGQPAPEGVATGQGTGVREIDELLNQSGVANLDTEKLGKHYEQRDLLTAAKKRAGGTGLSVSQSFRGSFMPFSDLSSMNFLPDVPSNATISGAKLFGGRVVGNREYQQATDRFKEGQASSDDIDAIAQYERTNEINADVRKRASFGQKFLLEMGGLGKLGGEAITGGVVIGKAASVAGRGAQAAGIASRPVATAAGTAPALPAAAAQSGLRQAAGFAAGQVPATAVSPSLYVPMMQQNNMANGRSANDIKGLPTAFGYGYANMLVLGRLSKGLEGTLLVDAAKKGLFGAVEMQGVDLAAGVADQFLNKAYQIKPDEDRWGTIGNLTRAVNAGDGHKTDEAMKDAAIQMLSFGAFAAIHGREQTGTDLASQFIKAQGKLRDSGMGKAKAASELSAMHDKLEEALSANPYLTREEAAAYLKDKAPKEAEGYAQALADVFEPKARTPAPILPEPVIKQSEPTAPTVREEPKTSAPEVRGEKPGYVPKPEETKPTAAAEPVPPELIPHPRKHANRTDREAAAAIAGEEAYDRALESGKSERAASKAGKAAYDSVSSEPLEAELAPTQPEPAKPPTPEPAATAAAPPAPEPGPSVPELQAEVTALESRAEELARDAVKAKLAGTSGPSLRNFQNRVKGAKALLESKKAEIEEARSKAEQNAAIAERQPETPVATPSEAPGRPVDEVVSSPAESPAKAAPEPPASNAERRLAMLARLKAGGRAGPPVEEGYTSPAESARPSDVMATGRVSPTGREVHPVQRLAEDSLRSNVDLSERQKGEYATSFQAVMEQMPPAARDRLGTSVKKVKFYKSAPEAGVANAREWLDDPSITPAQREYWTNRLKQLENLESVVVGAFNMRTGTLHIDGQGPGGATGRHPLEGTGRSKGIILREQVYSHEFGHGLDGPQFEHSTTQEWKNAWGREIARKVDGEHSLSGYASEKSSEGLAEFARILYSGEVPTSQIARDFPLATAYFKRQGWWPAERGPVKPPTEHVPATEVFKERVGPDNAHVDVGYASEPKVEPAQKAKQAPSEKAPLSEARAEEARRRADQEGSHEDQGPDAEVGSKHYAGLRNEFIDRILTESEATNDPAVRDALETVAWNFWHDKLVGHRGWKSVTGDASGKITIEEYADQVFRRDVQSALEVSPEHHKALIGTPAEAAFKKLAAEFGEKPATAAARPHDGSARRTPASDLPPEDMAALRESIENNVTASGHRTLAELNRSAMRFLGILGRDRDSLARSRNFPAAEKEKMLDYADRKIAAARSILDAMSEAFAQPKPAAVVTPPAPPKRNDGGRGSKRPPTPEEVRESWDSMDAKERYDALVDPALRQFYEANGVNVSAGARTQRATERNTAAKASGVGATAGKASHSEAFNAVAEDAELSERERQAVAGISAGLTLREIAKRTGGSYETYRKAAVRALEKIYERSKNTVAGREIAIAIRDLKEAGDPVTLEAVMEHMARVERLERGTSNAERGTVEITKDGHVSGGEGDGEISISGLARFFTVSGGSRRTILDKIKTLFFGDLPTAAQAAREQEIDGQIAAYAFDVKNAESDLRSALRKSGTPYERMDAAALKKLNDVLAGDAAARAGVSPEVLAQLDNMRSQIDNLSLALMGSGALDSPMIAVFGQNIGSYLTRQYEVFRDPAWAEKVPEAVRNRFKSWLVVKLAARGVVWTPERVEAEVRKLLLDGTAAENPIAFLKNSVLGAKDLSILKGRKDIPPELRALWGEVEDPIANYTNSVGKMSHLLTSHAFLERVAREGAGKFFFDEPTGDHVVTFADSADSRLAPLAGKFTTPEIKAAFEEVFAKENVSKPMEWYMKALAFAKFSKVVVSHVGQIRNFLGNIGFAVANGHFRLAKFPESLAAVARDTPAARDYWRKLTELGIVGEGLHYRDLQQTMADAMGDKRGTVADTLLGRVYRGSLKRAELMYHYGDSVWKVYAFENEVADYIRAGKTRAEAEAIAAPIVRDQNPTYSKIASGLKALRRAPFVAPFLSFQAEVVRTTKNTIKQAWAELRDANPKVRAIGAKRLAGVMLAATMPAALAAASAAMFGVDDEEEKAVRRFLPDYQKESSLAYVGRDEKGRVKYFDLSRTDPHSYLSDAISTALGGRPGAAVDELAKPFTSEELLVRPALDIARNQKEPGGKVYNPADSPASRAAAVGQHVGQAFVPGGYSAARRGFMGFSGQAEQRTGATYDPVDAGQEQVTGQRIETLRLEDQLASKARGYESGKSDAAKITQDVIRLKGSVPEDQLKSAYERTTSARAKTFEEFRQDVVAAERLGMSKPEIARVLKDAGLSVQDIGELFANRQSPYFPPIQGPASERVRAGSARKLAVP